jgi:hypothetical protein
MGRMTDGNPRMATEAAAIRAERADLRIRQGDLANKTRDFLARIPEATDREAAELLGVSFQRINQLRKS